MPGNQPPSLIGEDLAKVLMEFASTTPDGPIVEVGVYKGGSAWYLSKVAREQRRELHLFDTFTGIPCALPEDNHKVGDFGDTSVDAVMDAIPDAHFHVGVFPETLPDDLQGIAFVHADCDQYESAVAVIEYLVPRMVPGGIIVWDDYLCTWGVTKAVDEAFGNRVQLTRHRRGYVVI